MKLNGITIINGEGVDNVVNTQHISSYTRLLYTQLAKVVGAPTTLTADTVVDEYTISLASATGISAGDEIYLAQDHDNPASFFAKVISVSTNTVTVDSPLDKVFSTTSNGAIAFKVTTNMAVDGSTTRQIFDITNGSSHEFEFHRLIIHMSDGSAMDDGMLGGIAGGVDKGIILRVKYSDGTYHNLWNVKTNGEFGLIAYDQRYDDKAPSGTYGLTIKSTFSKLGGVVKLGLGEKLEVIIQDDLTDLTSLKMMAEGRYLE